MLDEDVELVLDLEESVRGRLRELLHHVAQLRVQVVHGTVVFVRDRDLKLNGSVLPGLLSASVVLESLEVFLFLENGLHLALLAREAADLALELDLEGLDGLLAARVVHVDVDLDLLAWGELSLLQRDHGLRLG